MAVPSYETDLLPIDLAEVDTAWTEPSATGWLQGAAPSQDDDNPFQGNFAVSKAFNAIGVGGMLANYGSGITIPTDGAFLGWFYWASPGSLETDANGGIRFMCGSALNNFYSWDVGGSTSYVYGGWINYAVNTTVTPDDTVGSPSGTQQYFGAAVNNTNSIFKGSPFLCDAFRYGRCEARMYGGETANYATFSGFAAVNDSISNRWGLIQAIAGGYLVKGLVTFGYGSAVDFRDSNKSIVIQDTTKVTANFNTFEVRNASSRVDWTSISFLALGTVSPGKFVMTDNADVNIDSCTFTDIGTFTFQSNGTTNDSTFRRCALITQGGAAFDGCVFDSSTSSTTILSNNPANISNCSFTSDGSNHALEINTTGTFTFANNSFYSYATSDGSTGNEVVYNNSGGLVTLNVTGSGAGTISVRNGTGASTVVASSASLIINIVDSDGNAVTENCEVTVVKNSDTTILFEEDNITDGTTTYSYSSGGGTVTYVNVLNVAGYQPKTVNNVTLPSSGSTTLAIQLDDDPFYSNP